MDRAPAGPTGRDRRRPRTERGPASRSLGPPGLSPPATGDAGGAGGLRIRELDTMAANQNLNQNNDANNNNQNNDANANNDNANNNNQNNDANANNNNQNNDANANNNDDANQQNNQGQTTRM
jgi:hypothetical protein